MSWPAACSLRFIFFDCFRLGFAVSFCTENEASARANIVESPSEARSKNLAEIQILCMRTLKIREMSLYANLFLHSASKRKRFESKRRQIKNVLRLRSHTSRAENPKKEIENETMRRNGLKKKNKSKGK
jgi:hypothetical protein